MLQNLRAEMARYGVSTEDLAKSIGRTERSVRDKISGKFEFTLPEGRTIRDQFFQGLTLEYLFAQADSQDSA